MYILKHTFTPKSIAYLKYDGWCLFNDCALDLNGCILFTKGETKLNPPGADEEYQYYGCYPAIKELK